MGGRAWTDEDIEYLKANAETMTNKEMADELGRTEGSVQLYVNRMGLKGDNGRKKRRIDTYATKRDFKEGDTIGRLKIKRIFVKETPAGMRTYCECVCTCGKEVERHSKDLHFRDNHSCGCAKTEKAAERFKTHGVMKDPAYTHWIHMRARCNDKTHESYQWYGGRGINIDPTWDNAGTFVKWAHENGFEEGLTLDRKNNDLGYGPDNCRWSTHVEQSNNRSDNRWLESFGERKTVSQWSQDPRAAVCEMTIRYRIDNDWSDHDAITVPKGERPNRKGRETKMVPGDEFNQLTLEELWVEERNGQRVTIGRFKCSCGGVKVCKATSVKGGITKSCGCLLRTKSKERIVELNKKPRR